MLQWMDWDGDCNAWKIGYFIGAMTLILGLKYRGIHTKTPTEGLGWPTSLIKLVSLGPKWPFFKVDGRYDK